MALEKIDFTEAGNVEVELKQTGNNIKSALDTFEASMKRLNQEDVYKSASSDALAIEFSRLKPVTEELYLGVNEASKEIRTAVNIYQAAEKVAQ